MPTCQQSAFRHLRLAVLSSFLLAYAGQSAAQFELPATDIWLLDLAERDGQVQLDERNAPVRLTRHPGYDNQPSFSHDGRQLYFTRGDAEGYTNIMQAQLDTLDFAIKPVVETPLSEFSALSHWNPALNTITMVQVQEDGAQWLVSYNPDNGNITRRDENDQVGYHSWFDKGSVVFTVADPARLEYWPAHAEKAQLIAEDADRGMLTAGDGKHPPQKVWLSTRDESGTSVHTWDGQRLSFVTKLPDGSQDFARDDQGQLWTGVGSKLYRWSSQQAQWRMAADLSAYRIRNITRLAIHPASRRLALVAAP